MCASSILIFSLTNEDVEVKVNKAILLVSCFEIESMPLIPRSKH